MSKYYHLRITCNRETSVKMADEFTKKFSPVEYAYSYEEKGDNLHMHGHLCYYDNEVPKKQTLSDFFKKHNLIGLYYHKELTKEPQNNLLYVMKDLDIIKHNLALEYYEVLMKSTQRINEDKKKHARHKLLDIIKQEHLSFIEKGPLQGTEPIDLQNYDDYYQAAPYRHLSDITKRIVNIYVQDYDKEPPLSHIRGYVLYIAEILKPYWEHPGCVIPIELDIYYQKLV